MENKKEKDELEIINVKSIIDQMEGRDIIEAEVVESSFFDTDYKKDGVVIHSSIDTPELINSDSISKAIVTIKELYSSYKDRYGIEVDFDINELNQNFFGIVDPEKRKLFEITLSDTLDRIRLVTLSKLTIALMVAIDKLTSPEFLSGLSPIETIGMTDKIFNYLEKISKLKKLLPINDTDLELKKLISDNKSQRNDPEVEMKILDILTQLRSENENS